MRIAVVMPRGSQMRPDRPNSMETVARTLAGHSRFEATTVFVCASGSPQPTGVETRTVKDGLSKPGYARAVTQVLRALAPEIVEHHQQLESSAAIARRLPGRVHLFYRHTRIKPPHGRVDRARYEHRLAAFDQLVFVSDAARDEFLLDYPRFVDRAVTIPTPIDVETWRAPTSEREPLILFSGRAMEEKGLEPFCQALAGVLDRHPDWRGALLLGDWDRHRAWAEPRLKPLERFGDRVEIHRSASLPTVIDLTRRAAIAVTPSFVAEALGLTALEAHAAGAALVSSGRGGLREASGAFAVYVDPPSASGLQTAVNGLIEDAAGRLEMAAGGQAWVEAVRSPAHAAARLDDLRARLIREAGARRRPPGGPRGLAALIHAVTGGARRDRRIAHIRGLPDRRLLIESYVPALAEEGGRLLWVGCSRYTAADYAALESRGAEVWTSDIESRAAKWGHTRRHRIGDLCRIDAIFKDMTFDAIVCNGVFGYGVDTSEQQAEALAAMAAILRPGGRLLLGWNTDKIADPATSGHIATLFTGAALAGQPSRVRFDDVTHVYDSLIRR